MSTATIDQQFIEYVVKSLVSNPDDVIVDRRIDEKGVLLTLTVNPEDLGRVIGKRGATAQSLRTLLRALGTKQESRFNLKIVDNGEQKPAPSDQGSGGGWASAPSSTNSSDDTSSDESSDNSNRDEENTSSAAEQAANDSGEEQEEREESAVERTRRELEDLDDLDV